VSHIIRDEDKESGVSAQGREQDRILNQYEYDAFGNTISCKEQVENRFRYTGEQYDPLTGQYYLRARYYNPVIARFTQEDTYYGDGLNLYTYCQNNPILYHDPTGHGTKENSPYSRKEQQYIDAGADPDTARLAAQCYPDAKSKQDLYNKYKKQGYSAQDAKKLANREIIHGEEATKKYIKDNNVKKSGPDYTATSPRDNVNTDWRTQERLNAQRNAGAGKGNESGNKSGTETDLFLPDEFYNKNLPNQVAPGTKYLPKYDELGNVKHIKMYDDCGREIGWGDYTNHGYGDINSPHYHTTPHWHEKIYNAQYPDGIKINHRTDVNTPLGDK
jgi:RHS repeat-associated protein